MTPYSSFGQNDRFYIPGLQVFPHASIQIFNRWGNLVHEDTDYDQSFGWDPRADGATSGVYHYILRLLELPATLIVSDGMGGETTYEGDAPAVFEGSFHVVD